MERQDIAIGFNNGTSPNQANIEVTLSGSPEEVELIIEALGQLKFNRTTSDEKYERANTLQTQLREPLPTRAIRLVS